MQEAQFQLNLLTPEQQLATIVGGDISCGNSERGKMKQISINNI